MLHEEKTLPTPGSKYPPIQHAKRAALTATHGRQGCWGRGEASAPAAILGGGLARPPPMPTEEEKGNPTTLPGPRPPCRTVAGALCA